MEVYVKTVTQLLLSLSVLVLSGISLEGAEPAVDPAPETYHVLF